MRAQPMHQPSRAPAAAAAPSKVPSNGASQKAIVATSLSTGRFLAAAASLAGVDDATSPAAPPDDGAQVPSNGASQKAIMAASLSIGHFAASNASLPSAFGTLVEGVLFPAASDDAAEVPSNGASQKAIVATRLSIAAIYLSSLFEFNRLVLVGDEMKAAGGRLRLYMDAHPIASLLTWFPARTYASISCGNLAP